MTERKSLSLMPGASWQWAVSDHPGEESWERLATGAVSGDERLAILDHVVACAECTRIYRALVVLEENAREIEPELPAGGLIIEPEKGRRFDSKTLFGGLALAAAAALVLLVRVPGPSPLPEGDREVTRAPGAERPVLLEPGEGAAWTSAFRWQVLDGATGYRLELLDAVAEPLWAADVGTVVVLDWPAEVERRPGRHYWRVIAILGSGTEVASELASFEVVPAD
ncbi:MAG: hypothetical protein ACE5GX_06440 [Thermoanaerobaculia bacterium]